MRWSILSGNRHFGIRHAQDWCFLNREDGQPGEPANWVKKRIRLYKKWKDELHTEIIEDLKRSDQVTRNITSPSTPQKHNLYEMPFDLNEILGNIEMDDDSDDG
jgi:hypothetical protein